MGYYNQTCQNDKLVCTDFTRQVLTTSLQLGHAANINDLISTYGRPIATNFDSMVDHRHYPYFEGGYDVATPGSRGSFISAF